MEPKANPARGMALLAISSLCFSLMGTITHAIKLPFWEVSLSRGLVSIVIVAPWVLGQKLSLVGKEPAWMLLRSLAGSFALIGYFYCLGTLPLADATLLTYSSPLWIALLAPLLLKEKFKAARLLAVGVGFLGLGILLGPNGRWLTPGGIAGLLSGFSGAFAYIAVRRLRGDHPLTVVLHYAVVSALVSLPGTAIKGRIPEGLEWLGLLGVGLTAVFGQWLMTRGYRLVEASAGSVMNLLVPVFAQVLGVLIFREALSVVQFVGGALVISAVLLLSRVEAKSTKDTLPAS